VEDDGPVWAFVFSLIAGLLMILDGLFESLAGSLADELGAGFAGGILSALGFFGILFGLVVVILAVAVFRRPENHTMFGITILVLSLFSVVGGGGFLVGIVLGIIGGALAILFEESEDIAHDPVRGHDVPTPVLANGTPGPRASSPRVCPNCHTALPPGAARCPDCETPVPRTT